MRPPGREPRPAWWRVLLWLCFLCTVACTPARREVRGDLITQVRFEGNGGPFSGHNDYQLRSQLEQERSGFGALLFPLMYVARPAVLNPSALDLDAWRIEVWYAHHGWFDARFHGWAIHEIRARGRKRSAVVEATGLVEPGPLSVYREFEIEGLDRTTTLFANSVRRTGFVCLLYTSDAADE